MREIVLGSDTEEGVRMADKEDETDIGQANAADPEVADAADPEVAEEAGPVDTKHKSTKAKALRISVSIRTLVVATLIAGVLASAGVPTWLYIGAKARLDEQARQAANNGHAERIALDYAVDAAKINVQDMDTWKKNLVKGTTPELKEKLSSAAKAMDQILVPMQWNSTAIPLAAKVRSNTNGIYVVDAFVGVQTKTVQAPDGLQSTATYSITIDTSHDWQISDVGGIGTAVGQK
jgi:Mce-associated membrane protein